MPGSRIFMPDAMIAARAYPASRKAFSLRICQPATLRTKQLHPVMTTSSQYALAANGILEKFRMMRRRCSYCECATAVCRGLVTIGYLIRSTLPYLPKLAGSVQADPFDSRERLWKQRRGPHPPDRRVGGEEKVGIHQINHRLLGHHNPLDLIEDTSPFLA